MITMKVPGGRNHGGTITLELPDLPAGDAWLTSEDAARHVGMKFNTFQVAATRRDGAPHINVKGRNLFRLTELNAWAYARTPEGKRKAREAREDSTARAMAEERPDLAVSEPGWAGVQAWFADYDDRVGDECEWMTMARLEAAFRRVGVLPPKRKRGKR